jgi:hypothetical protein
MAREVLCASRLLGGGVLTLHLACNRNVADEEAIPAALAR